MLIFAIRAALRNELSSLRAYDELDKGVLLPPASSLHSLSYSSSSHSSRISKTYSYPPLHFIRRLLSSHYSYVVKWNAWNG